MFARNLRLCVLVMSLAMLTVTVGAKKKCTRGVMTWYSREDNESNIGSFDNVLVPYKSAATIKGMMPLRAKVYVARLKGFPLGNGAVHDGWVRIVDECRGSGCRMLDLYVGSNAQRARYQAWMRKRVKDPDVPVVVACRT